VGQQETAIIIGTDASANDVGKQETMNGTDASANDVGKQETMNGSLFPVMAVIRG